MYSIIVILDQWKSKRGAVNYLLSLSSVILNHSKNCGSNNEQILMASTEGMGQLRDLTVTEGPCGNRGTLR